jgi:hypothetical protein
MSGSASLQTREDLLARMREFPEIAVIVSTVLLRHNGQWAVHHRPYQGKNLVGTGATPAEAFLDLVDGHMP